MNKDPSIIKPIFQLLDESPDLILIGDLKDNRIIYANEKMAQSIGIKRKELLGKTLYDVLPTSIAEKRIQMASEVAKKKSQIQFEDYRNGRYFINHLFPLYDEKKTIYYVATITKDITDQRISEYKYQRLVNHMTEGMALLDLKGHFLYINKIIKKRSGLTEQEFCKYTIFDIILPEYKERSKKYFQQLISGKKVKPFEIAYRTKNNKTLYVEINASAIYEQDRMIGIQALTIDITDRKAAEEAYRTVVDNSLQGLGIIQNDHLIFINDAFTSMFGYSKKQLVSFSMKSLMNKIHPDDIHQVKKLYKKRKRGEKAQDHFELRIKTRQGNYRWFETIASLIEHNNKQATQLAIVDIHDKKQAQQALIESEKRFRDIITHSTDVFYIHDVHHNLQYVSPQVKDILGYSPDEMMRKWTELSTKNPLNEEGLSLTEKALKTGRKQRPYLLELQRKDERPIMVRINESPIKDAEGSVIGITGMLSDVTEQIQAENELKASQMALRNQKNYLQNVIDSASEFIFTINADGIVRTWNATAVKTTGYKKKEIVGKNIKKITVFLQPELVLNYIQDIVHDTANQITDLSIKSKYGMQRYLKVSPSIIRDKENQIREVLFVCKDITDEKKIQEKLNMGYSYLISDASFDMHALFFHFISIKYQGMYISRSFDQKQFGLVDDRKIKMINLGDDAHHKVHSLRDIETLFSEIETFLIKNKQQKKVIFFDRIDYLIMFHPFDSIIRFLYHVNDLIGNTDALFFLYLNPDIITPTQWKLLEIEFSQIPSEQIKDIYLDTVEYDILKYIALQQSHNTRVNHKRIGTKFHLSKVTVKKYVDSLLNRELIYSEKHGRTKYIFLTMKGKNIIEQ